MQSIQIKLFDGEKLPIQEKENPSQKPHPVNDESISAKYIAQESRIITEQARYPLESIVRMLDAETDDGVSKYKLDAEFQRRRRWDRKRQSRLIESFIMNVPVPPIFLYEIEYASYEVMDGQQRMGAIYDFYKDTFALEDLQYWKELEGRRYSDLPKKIREAIDRRYISSIILLKESAKSEQDARNLQRVVFERLNSGGIKLEPQEARNAIYSGKFNTLCIELANSEKAAGKIFRDLWNFNQSINLNETDDDSLEINSNNPWNKMEDVELVLRFFAYRQIDRFQGSLVSILDRFLDFGNRSFSDDLLSLYESLFNETIILVNDVLGKSAFLLWRRARKGSRRDGEWEWSKQPMKVVYDPIMQAFSQYAGNPGILKAKKSVIQSKLTEFYQENDVIFGGRKTTVGDVTLRITKMQEFLRGIL